MVLESSRLKVLVSFSCLAVRMAGGVELGVAVEAGRLDDERVAVPAAGGHAVPGLGEIGRPLEVGVERHPVEPGVLLEQERERSG